MTSKFRSTVWDPILLVFQIISMQLQFYFTLSIIIYLINIFFNLIQPKNDLYLYSLDKIFNFKSINFIEKSGRLVSFAFLANSFLSALFEYYIINRTKQCLDFTVTVYFYHILFCWFYNSQFPNTFSFWFTIVLSTSTMTLLSEYLCMKAELKEIPLGLIPKTNV
jgi:hypothetical protein